MKGEKGATCGRELQVALVYIGKSARVKGGLPDGAGLNERDKQIIKKGPDYTQTPTFNPKLVVRKQQTPNLISFFIRPQKILDTRWFRKIAEPSFFFEPDVEDADLYKVHHPDPEVKSDRPDIRQERQ